MYEQRLRRGQVRVHGQHAVRQRELQRLRGLHCEDLLRRQPVRRRGSLLWNVRELWREGVHLGCSVRNGFLCRRLLHLWRDERLPQRQLLYASRQQFLHLQGMQREQPHMRQL